VRFLGIKKQKYGKNQKELKNQRYTRKIYKKILFHWNSVKDLKLFLDFKAISGTFECKWLDLVLEKLWGLVCLKFSLFHWSLVWASKDFFKVSKHFSVSQVKCESIWVWETSSRLGPEVGCVSTCVELGFYWSLLQSVLCCLLLATDSLLFWFLSYFQVFPSNFGWKWSLLWLFVSESCSLSRRNWLLTCSVTRSSWKPITFCLHVSSRLT